MKIRLIRESHIPQDAPVRVTQYGKFADIVYLKRKPKPPCVRRVSGGQYVDIETGEVKAYLKGGAGRRRGALLPVYRKLKHLIAENFKTDKSAAMIALSYQSPMLSEKTLAKDTRNFVRRLKSAAGKKVEYITITEAAGNSLHAHVLVKSADGSPLKLTRAQVRRRWSNGYSNVRHLTGNIIKIADYFTSYRKVEAAAQFGLSGRIYRASMGLKQPKKERMTYEQATKLYRPIEGKGRTIQIYARSGRIAQTIIKESARL